MTSQVTANFQLNRLVPGASLSDDDNKYGDADRQTMDTLIDATLKHHHIGGGAVLDDPTMAPQLKLATTGGTIPGGLRVFYKYAHVSLDGQETAPSPEAFIDTPPQLATPGPPTATVIATLGTLPGAMYYYAVSAWAGSNTAETRASAYANVVAPNVPTNTIRVGFPSLPSGASGFNIYRRKPGQSKFFYLTSIDMTVMSPPTFFDDDGTVLDDCDRTLPQRNTTNSTNMITVSYPGATPAVALGYTWKIFRTYVPNNYAGSLLHHVVEETFEGSGVITPEYVDVGIATQAGTPVASTLFIPQPDPIDLETETSGALPLGRTAFVEHIEFAFAGTLEVTQGAFTWICTFPHAKIRSVQAALGRGAMPAVADVIIDVNLGPNPGFPGTPSSYTTIYTTQGNRPTVPVGSQIGVATGPDVTLLERGDVLTIDIDQVGGGATPTDENLVVSVDLIAYGYTEVSFDPNDDTYAYDPDGAPS